MRNLSMGAATAGLLIALLSGCASSPVVMRGQSPDAYAQAPQGGPVQQVNPNYNQQVYGNGMDYANYQANCPPEFAGDGSGRCIPRQHYKFRYVVPQGLNYPPQNAMPGVIQYPYYTVKGPDCFFHQ